MKSFKKNPPEWDEKELFKEMIIFKELYKERPIKNNIHGMRFQHMFATYFILKKINPSFVIESGVFKGQSTWLIEKTLPNSKILSIDINLSQRKYISKKALYSNIDFKNQDFTNIPKDTLVFFDDHVNHYERLQQAKFFNIKNIILEDNYLPEKGDFYSINHAYAKKGFNHNFTKLSLIKTLLVFMCEIIKKTFIKNYFFQFEKIKFRLRDYPSNENDFKNIEKNIKTYFEFPNLSDIIKPNLELSKEELNSYNHLTYIELY
tara:strand:+ start:221 stop:1006 length:786 start_codon:yes stop_codon:yes gene_type:complete